MTRSAAAVLIVLAVGSVIGAMQGAQQLAATSGDSMEIATIVPVTVVRVTPVNSINQQRTYTGTVHPRRSAEVGFERSARLIALHVDEGDVVEEGQLLAKLDTRRLHAKRAEIVARLQAAQAFLDELVAGPRQETIAAASAETEEFRSHLELATRTLDRVRSLADRNAVSTQSIDDAQFARDSAASRLEASRKRLEELNAGTRREKLAAQQAAVAQLAATLADVELEIEDSALTAPFTGRVAARFSDEGTVVAAGQPVFRIVEHQHLEAQIGIPTELIEHVETSATTTVVVNGRPVPSRFERSLPEVDMTTRTRIAVFSVEAAASASLVPGQIVQATISQPIGMDGYWLPTQALTPGLRGMWSAWAVVEEDHSDVVERRYLEVLHVRGDRVLVKGTIAAGDRFIAGGTQRVVPGQRVLVQE